MLPEGADWHEVQGAVVHVFTHFQLETRVWIAQSRGAFDPDNQGMWIASEKLGSSAIPSVMRKILELGLGPQSRPKRRGVLATG
jgi:A/G-specific adenine glycosylase